MSMKQEENDLYIIPPNFIESGTLFGGTVKIRNAIEAAIITLGVGLSWDLSRCLFPASLPH